MHGKSRKAEVRYPKHEDTMSVASSRPKIQGPGHEEIPMDHQQTPPVIDFPIKSVPIMHEGEQVEIPISLIRIPEGMVSSDQAQIHALSVFLAMRYEDVREEVLVEHDPTVDHYTLLAGLDTLRAVEMYGGQTVLARVFLNITRVLDQFAKRQCEATKWSYRNRADRVRESQMAEEAAIQEARLLWSQSRDSSVKQPQATTRARSVPIGGRD